MPQECCWGSHFITLAPNFPWRSLAAFTALLLCGMERWDGLGSLKSVIMKSNWCLGFERSDLDVVLQNIDWPEQAVPHVAQGTGIGSNMLGAAAP